MAVLVGRCWLWSLGGAGCGTGRGGAGCGAGRGGASLVLVMELVGTVLVVELVGAVLNLITKKIKNLILTHCVLFLVSTFFLRN